MAINDGDIQGSITAIPLRESMREVNAGTATVAGLNASQNSLAAKDVLRQVQAGSATRESIQAMAIDPTAKMLLMRVAGFENGYTLPMTGVGATGAVGTVV